MCFLRFDSVGHITLQKYKIETKQIEIYALFYYWERLVRRRATEGLVQGNSITETIEIARDVAKKLIEAQEQQIVNLAMLSNSFNYPQTNRFTTIPNHTGDMPEGTLRAILKQAGVNIDVFLNQR